MDDRRTRPERPPRLPRRSTREASPGLWQALVGERDSFTDPLSPSEPDDNLGSSTVSYRSLNDVPTPTRSRPTLTVTPSPTTTLRVASGGCASSANSARLRTRPSIQSVRPTSVSDVDDLDEWILLGASARRPRSTRSREAPDGSTVLPWPEPLTVVGQSRSDWAEASRTSRVDRSSTRTRENRPAPVGWLNGDWPAVSDVQRAPPSSTIPGRSGSMWQAVPVARAVGVGEVDPRPSSFRMPRRSRADWPAVIGSSRDSWSAIDQSGRSSPYFGRRDLQLAMSGQWETVPRLGGRPARSNAGAAEWGRLIAVVVGVAFAWQVIVAFARPTSSDAVAGTDAPLASSGLSGEVSGPPSEEVAARNNLVGTPNGDGDDPVGGDVEDAEDGEAVVVVVPTPTAIPPTRVPPTRVPPTRVPPTRVPPTRVPPTRVPPTRVPAGVSRHMTVTAYCLRTLTSSGSYPSPGIAAAGPAIAMGSRFSVPGYGEVVVADRNASFGTDELDVWFSDCAQATRWGRKQLTVVAIVR
jgi:3D (Asp-Asp-Asp) domain-containing protein